MHWFVWLLVILTASNIGLSIAKTSGWEPKPTSGWISLVINALLLAGIIAYLA